MKTRRFRAAESCKARLRRPRAAAAGRGARAPRRSASCEGARDLHLVNGRFLTMDPRRPVVSAVAIRAGRIVGLGHAEDLGPCARTINLKGATAVPGLMDSHVHFIRCGQNPGHEVRIIETAASVTELAQMISARIKELAVPAGSSSPASAAGTSTAWRKSACPRWPSSTRRRRAIRVLSPPLARAARSRTRRAGRSSLLAA